MAVQPTASTARLNHMNGPCCCCLQRSTRSPLGPGGPSHAQHCPISLMPSPQGWFALHVLKHLLQKWTGLFQGARRRRLKGRRRVGQAGRLPGGLRVDRPLDVAEAHGAGRHACEGHCLSAVVDYYECLFDPRWAPTRGFLNHHPHSHVVAHGRPKAASHPQWHVCPYVL